ncbi:hypothetical protein H4R18_001648 [Coemansia javaensis]|uniref:Uncharacterized protein n=1 Tax=Coemansia javaensis TaxID=2761396 RepID=A0A9W8HEB8_9FUNG|nr:hypothetical protein H4R18_001648 [Coemansia javaensis]
MEVPRGSSRSRSRSRSSSNILGAADVSRQAAGPRPTGWQAVGQAASACRAWVCGLFRPGPVAYLRDRRTRSDARARVTSNLRSFTRADARGRIRVLRVSVMAISDPAPALADALERLRRMARVWRAVEVLELEIALTGDSALELIRSPMRFEMTLRAARDGFAALLPGPLRLVPADRSGCAVVGQLFAALAAHYSTDPDARTAEPRGSGSL